MNPVAIKSSPFRVLTLGNENKMGKKTVSLLRFLCFFVILHLQNENKPNLMGFKIRQWTVGAMLVGLMALTSCIKDEPLNTECDILEASLTVANPAEVFFHESDSLVRVSSEDGTVMFTVRRSADLTQMAPRFKITEGATITPASGSVHDFSQGPVAYRVTSQDGQWSRNYTVGFQPVTVVKTETIAFDFEHFELDDVNHKYYVWYEQGEQGTEKIWASGNGGYFIANQSKPAADYPTIPVEGGLDGGYCLKLTTIDTGPLGRATGRPIAAGNMFLGAFNIQLALRDALHATEMGIPFAQTPVKLTGYYKYQRGAEYKNKQQQIVPERVDSADIYSVLYRNHDAEGLPVVLYGDNVLTSPLIVRKARVAEVKETDEWTYFEIDYEQLGDIDEELLQNRGYNLALVFSSSIHGDVFEGAIGSILYIDKVRIICTREE